MSNKYKSKIAHFNAPTVVENFIENADGSITKRALVLVEGKQTDSKKREHIFSAERIRRIVQNTNSAFKNNSNIPMFKEHQKNIDNMIGNVASTFEARTITADDLTATASPDLIGKLGVFCDGLVIKAGDVVDKVKSGLAKELSPGIDIIKDRIMEISVVAQPAIQGMAMYSKGEYDDKKTLTFEDYDKCMEECEADREEYDELCEKFYTVANHIVNASEEELQGQDQTELMDQAFKDFNFELRSMFMGELQEDDDEEDPNGDQPNPYSLKQGSQVESPYSLYPVDSADFAVPGVIKPNLVQRTAQSYTQGLRRIRGAGKDAFKGNWQGAGNKVKNYFTKANSMNLNRTVGTRSMRWGRVGKAGASAIGAGALGYGALKVGSNVTGIGKKKETNRFNFKF